MCTMTFSAKLYLQYLSFDTVGFLKRVRSAVCVQRDRYSVYSVTFRGTYCIWLGVAIFDLGRLICMGIILSLWIQIFNTFLRNITKYIYTITSTRNQIYKLFLRCPKKLFNTGCQLFNWNEYCILDFLWRIKIFRSIFLKGIVL